MFEIQVCSKHGKLLKSFAVGDKEEVIVGRDDSCDIRIDARSVSREHCAIEAENGEMYLRDLGSSGGTYANGQRVERVRIEDGIEICVGPAVLRFIDSGL